MNAFLTARQLVLRAILLCAALLTACALALSSSPVDAGAAGASAGAAGQAIALRAALDPAATRALLQKELLQRGLSATPGRFVYDPKAPQYALASGQNKRVPGLRRRAQAALTSPVQIAEPTQTYDVFAPPPAFTPGDGALTPANAFPVWTSDERYLVFSRQVTGTDGTTHFHLFSVSANGDTPGGTSTLHQITTGSGDEYFPALNPSNNGQLAFTSTAVTGVSNLYVMQGFSPQTTVVDPSTLTPLTVRTDLTDGNPVASVGRPTWSPSGQQIAFAGVDAGGTYAGVSHIYSLFVSSEGGLFGTAPTPDNPPLKMTDGPANDADPAWSPDGQFIAFDSTATTISGASPAVTVTPRATRSLYLLRSSGSGRRISNNGTDDFCPAWNPVSALAGQLAFSRGPAGGLHDVFYYQAYTQDMSGAYVVANETGDAVQLNTDDTGNVYDDVYPTFSPSVTLPEISYQSDRSVTYNDPATGSALETAVSLARGATGAFGVTVGAGYEGLLVSRIANVDPPTLLPYTPGEVVHITDTTDLTGPVRRNGDIKPGASVTFTVRLSDRESGVDPNNVYIQIKDPDSRYQDSQGLEHKVFTQDAADSQNTTPNPNTGNIPSNGDDGSASEILYNMGLGNAEQQFFTMAAPAPVGEFKILRGAVGGWDGTAAITLGYAGGGYNPVTVTTGTAPNVQTGPLPGGNPALFTTFGQEYECQYVNPNFAANGATDTAPTDYGTPQYLAGIDDSTPNSGAFFPPPTDAQGRLEWLKLAALPAAQQDGLGGVLFQATWTTPTSASDYYLDVIAYDQAQTPPLSGAVAPNFRIYDNVWGFSTQPFTGSADILVISDNTLGQKFVGSTFGTGGFLNLPPIFYGAESYFTDIDVNKLPNAIYRYVVPGTAEDPVRSSTTTGRVIINPMTGMPEPYAADEPEAEVVPLSTSMEGAYPALNGLGVASYPANTTDSSIIGGVVVPRSQQYSLWRTLARGGITPDVLLAYSPGTTVQPAVNDGVEKVSAPAADGATNADGTTDPAPVLSARRCVIYASPYTGDFPLNITGSLADAQTQQTLRAFVLGGKVGSTTLPGGGRLCVSGQDVASALTLNGSVPALNSAGSFVYDVLNATLVLPNGGNQHLTGGGASGNRISYDSLFNANVGLRFTENFFTQNSTDGFVYSPPSSNPLLLGNNYISLASEASLWRTDGSGDQTGPVTQTFGGQNNVQSAIDVIAPQNGAHTDFNFAGPGFNAASGGTGQPGLIYDENANGSRVVFGSFGLEGLGQEYFKYTYNNIDTYFSHQQRTNVLRNVVNYLRTGTVTGSVQAGSGGGQVIAGATVYMRANGGTIPANSRQLYSATTASDGTFRIDGVEPGSYSLSAYKTGYTRTDALFPFQVEGDETATGFNLNLNPVQPGSLTGQVTDLSTGTGIPNAAVTFDDGNGTTLSATTDANGNYDITSAPVGTYTGTASATGYITSTPQTGVVVQTGAATTVNFVLTPKPATITVNAVDASTGLPLPGVTVTLTPPTGGAAIPSQTTNSSGNATFSNLPATITGTTYTITATLAGYTTATAMQAVTPGQTFPVTLRLTPLAPATIDVHVVDTGGLPLPGATVTLTPPTGGAAIPSQTTDAGGNATFPNLPAAAAGTTYTITVTLAGYTPATVTQSVTPGQTAPVTVTLNLAPAPATIDVHVVDTGGAALPGASVTISPDPNTAGAQTTDAGGNATFPNLPAVNAGTTYTLTATLAGYTGSPVTQVVTPGKTFTATIVLTPPPATIDVQVVDSISGAVLPGASVTISPDPNTAGAQTTDAGGNAAFPNLPAVNAGTTYTFTATLAGYTGSPVTQVVTPGKTFTATIRLTPPPAAIIVHVVDSISGASLPGASVTISPAPNAAGAQTTDARGVATFTNLPTPTSGTSYTLTATLPGYTGSPVTQAVTPGTTSTVTIRLTPPNGTLGGLVNDSLLKTPLTGATVSVFATGTATALQTTTTAAATSPAAPTGDGAPQNYAFTLAPGTYDVTVSKQGFGSVTLTGFKVLPAAFTRADFVDTNALKALHIFPAGYNFFSVPYDYTGTGLTFDTVFGVLNQGSFTATPPTINPANANRSHAYVWQPQLLQYVSDPTPPADTLRIGQGYWIYLNSPAELTVPGTTPSGTTISVGLSAGWNMIGVPSTSAISVSSLSFAGNGGTSITFADASGAAYRLIQGTLYTYPSGSAKGTSYIPVTSSDSLEPYQAYWIYAYVNTTIQIPTGSSSVASARPGTSPVSSNTSSTASGASSSSSSSSRLSTVRVRGRTH